MENARPTLLNAAREFMRRSAGTAVLVIVPLAAVQVASTARAQTIFQLPGSASDINRDGTSALDVTGPTSYFESTLGVTANGRNGSLMGASVSYTLLPSGSSFVRRAISFTSSASVPFTNGSIPVSYSFTLGTSGSITNLSWSLVLQTDSADSAQTIASGTGVGAGTFTGLGGYAVTDGSSASSYTLELITSYNSGIGDTLTITMNQGAGQGFALNATAIPEPSTYAGFLGLIAGMLALFRRRRLQPAVG